MRQTCGAMQGTRLLTAGVAVVAALAFATPASGSGAAYLFYTAQPGETNKLTLGAGPEMGEFGKTWSWVDGGANITAVPPMCVAPGKHIALCHPIEPFYISDCRYEIFPREGPVCPEGSVLLGDGDDIASIDPSTGFPWSIRGGPGNDEMSGALTIRGEAGDDVMHGEFASGGPFGKSHLVGGPGFDQFIGGIGTDLMDARDHERDRIVCGPGKDQVIGDWNDTVPRGSCERVWLTKRP